nr:MAG TPA: hypothetical protein [Caudoviricetes sp.]
MDNALFFLSEFDIIGDCVKLACGKSFPIYYHRFLSALLG